MKVLIVDADPHSFKCMGEMIEKWGHRIENAGSGGLALKLVRRQQYDLIILDMHLPDVKGYELIPQVKNLSHRVSIITMTEYNSRELERQVRTQGVACHVIKPIEKVS